MATHYLIVPYVCNEIDLLRQKDEIFRWADKNGLRCLGDFSAGQFIIMCKNRTELAFARKELGLDAPDTPERTGYWAAVWFYMKFGRLPDDWLQQTGRQSNRLSMPNRGWVR